MFYSNKFLNKSCNNNTNTSKIPILIILIVTLVVVVVGEVVKVLVDAFSDLMCIAIQSKKYAGALQYNKRI